MKPGAAQSTEDTSKNIPVIFSDCPRLISLYAMMFRVQGVEGFAVGDLHEHAVRALLRASEQLHGQGG